MTDTTEIAFDASQPSRGGLAGMNVAELKGLASGLGITGTGRMRKDELVAAITARRSGGPARTDGSPAYGASREDGPPEQRPDGAPAEAPSDHRAEHNGSFERPSVEAEQAGTDQGERVRAGRP